MADIFSNQTIQNFYETAYRKDFARTNLFRLISIETGDAGINFSDEDLVYVKSTSLPRRAISNIPLPFMGLKFNLPGTASYPGSDSWSVTFRMPADLSLRAKLEAWTRATFDDATSTGAYNLGNLGTIVLALMDKAGNVIRDYRLVGAYCTSFGEYNLDITSEGTVVEQTLNIAYQYWD